MNPEAREERRSNALRDRVGNTSRRLRALEASSPERRYLRVKLQLRLSRGGYPVPGRTVSTIGIPHGRAMKQVSCVFSVATVLVILAMTALLTQPVRAQEESKISPLKEVTYLQEAGNPRVLFDANGNAIVRVEVLTAEDSGTRQRIVKLVATGETIRTVEATEETSQYLCLDAGGAIVTADDEPLLVDPFDVYVSRYPGMLMGGTDMDVYGRPAEKYRYVYPCRSATEDHCTEYTGYEACVFVWPV